MNNHTKERIRLAISWLTLFSIGTDLFVVSPILPSIAADCFISPSIAGWMVSSFSIMYAIGAPVFGFLSDRFGRKKLIGIGLIAFSCANLLTSLASSFIFLIIVRILAGLSAAAVTPSIYAITGELAPHEKRGSWLAIVGSGLLIALWAGTPIGTFLSDIAGWKSVFFVLAITSLFLAILNLWLLPKDVLFQKQQSRKITKRTLLTIAVNVSITAFWGTSVYGMYTYLGTILQVFQHVSTSLIAIGLVIYGIGATTGSIYGGKISDRFGFNLVSFTSMFGLSVSLFVIGATFFYSETWVFPMLFLWSCIGYAFFPAYQSRLANRFPDLRGTVLAWNNTALYTGITIGSLVGSWVLHTLQFEYLPILCGGIALVGGMLCYIQIRFSPSSSHST